MDDAIRAYLTAARIGRLATADADGRPSVVPVCFALVDDAAVIPLDEKPTSVSPGELRRVRDIGENPRVALVVDHYTVDWDDLGWVLVHGTAEMLDPGADRHEEGIAALRAKYDQYETHELETRPVIRIDIGSVRSWGSLNARPLILDVRGRCAPDRPVRGWQRGRPPCVLTPTSIRPY